MTAIKGYITHKVKSVDDEICHLCHQLWDNSCRAFQQPHSKEERTQRLKGRMLCDLPKRKR